MISEISFLLQVMDKNLPLNLKWWDVDTKVGNGCMRGVDICISDAYPFSRGACQPTVLKDMWVNSGVKTNVVIVLLLIYVVEHYLRLGSTWGNKKELFANCPHPHTVWGHNPCPCAWVKTRRLAPVAHGFPESPEKTALDAATWFVFDKFNKWKCKGI